MSRKKKSDPMEDLTWTVIIIAAILMGIVYFSPWSWIIIGIVLLVVISNAMSKNNTNKHYEEIKKTKKGLIEQLEELNNKMEEKEEKRKQQELEQEMDNYGLDEDEKKLVRSGEYEPYQFEEEDMDEDDYYSDDDVF